MKTNKGEFLQTKIQNIFIIDKLIYEGKLTMSEIDEQFSGFVILCDIDNYIWKWVPDYFVDQFGIDIEEDQKLPSIEFGLKYVEPNYIAKYVEALAEAKLDTEENPFELLEYGRGNPEMDYFWIHKVLKFSKRNGCLITIAHDLRTISNEMLQGSDVLEEYSFLRENYNKFTQLTERQKEVLKLLALGFTNQEAAVELNISPNTVRTFRNQINGKLDLRWKSISHSRVYVQYATAFGLINN